MLVGYVMSSDAFYVIRISFESNTSKVVLCCIEKIRYNSYFYIENRLEEEEILVDVGDSNSS